MPPGFQAAKGLLSNSGESCQLLLRKSEGLSFANDVPGDRHPDELEGRDVASASPLRKAGDLAVLACVSRFTSLRRCEALPPTVRLSP